MKQESVHPAKNAKSISIVGYNSFVQAHLITWQSSIYDFIPNKKLCPEKRSHSETKES